MQTHEPPAAARQPRAADLCIALLGVPTVSWRGRPLQLARRQARALLYRLAAVQTPVPRDELCRLLATDGPPNAARPLLSVLLSYLRRALPASGVLCTDGDTVALDNGLVWIDTATFDAARGGESLDRLVRAVELYRGPFLDGTNLGPVWDDWAARERMRWERRYLDALAMLIERHAALGMYSAAIDYARRAVAVDSLDEANHRRLMHLYALGGQRTLALRQYESCVALLRRELGVAPQPETRGMYTAICDGKHPPVVRAASAAAEASSRTPPVSARASATPRPGAVPAAPYRIIGRDEHIAAAVALLNASHGRLLTLSGTGGSGKSRLAVAIASAVAHAYQEVVWAALGPIGEVEQVCDALVQACGVQPGARPPLDALLAHLRDKELLLVVDNFEHVLAAAPLLCDLLATAPGVQIVVTSRCPLRLPQEFVLEVPPLPLPDLERLSSPEALAEQPAVALLVERARQKHPFFMPSAHNRQQLAAICARLDGLPLAIELAAARLALLTPEELLRRLDQRLSVLTHTWRDVPRRQRTLRDTVAWSYDLLHPAEQRLFERVAVFAGGWTLEAAKAVCGDGAERVHDSLDALLDAHMISAVEAEQSVRYTMLETLRAYGLEQLRERGDEATVRQLHGGYYLRLAEEHSVRRQLHAAPQLLAVLDRDYNNLRSALECLIENQACELSARLVDALHWYWELRGLLQEGLAWHTRVLGFGILVPQPRRARVRSLAALLTGLHGRHDEASAMAALVLVDDEAQPSAVVIASNVAGTAAMEAGDLQLARAHLERSLALVREHGLLQDVTEAELKIALCLLIQGKLAEAEATMRSSYTAAEQLGQPRHQGLALLTLAFIATLRDDAEQAAACLAESVRLLRAVRETTLLPYALLVSSMVAALQGRPRRALLLWSAAGSHAGSSGLALLGPVLERAAALIEPLRERLDPAFAAAIEDEGRSLELEAALAVALDEPQ